MSQHSPSRQPLAADWSTSFWKPPLRDLGSTLLKLPFIFPPKDLTRHFLRYCAFWLSKRALNQPVSNVRTDFKSLRTTVLVSLISWSWRLPNTSEFMAIKLAKRFTETRVSPLQSCYWIVFISGLGAMHIQTSGQLSPILSLQWLFGK